MDITYHRKYFHYISNFFAFQIIIVLYSTISISDGKYQVDSKCEGNGQNLKYLWGDALTDHVDCIGPTNTPYPR